MTEETPMTLELIKKYVDARVDYSVRCLHVSMRGADAGAVTRSVLNDIEAELETAIQAEKSGNRTTILRWVQEEIITDIADWGGPQRVAWNDAANRLHELLDAAIANPSLQTSEELWREHLKTR